MPFDTIGITDASTTRRPSVDIVAAWSSFRATTLSRKRALKAVLHFYGKWAAVRAWVTSAQQSRGWRHAHRQHRGKERAHVINLPRPGVRFDQLDKGPGVRRRARLLESSQLVDRILLERLAFGRASLLMRHVS